LFKHKRPFVVELMPQQKRTNVEAQPTAKQISRLCGMIYLAFVEIRLLAANGELEQTKAFANTFHNLPSV